MFSTTNEPANPALEAERESYAIQVAQYAGMVFALALARLGSRETAEDLSQEVFLRAWLHRGARPGRPRAFMLWIGGLTRALAHEWQERGQLRSALLGSLRLGDPYGTDAEPRPTTRFQALQVIQEQRRQLESELRDLPIVAREIFLLHHVEQMEIEAIAGLLKMEKGTVARLVRQTQPDFDPAAVQFLGPADDLAARALEAVAAADQLPDPTRKALADAGRIDRLKLPREARGGRLVSIVNFFERLLLAPFLFPLRVLRLLLSPRGLAMLFMVLSLGGATIYLAYLGGWISPDMLPPLFGPPPPASILQLYNNDPERPYYGHEHNQKTDHRAELAIAAREAGGELVAYQPKPKGVLVAVTWADGRRLAGAFQGKAELFVESIRRDPDDLIRSGYRESANADGHPYTVWFLVTY